MGLKIRKNIVSKAITSRVTYGGRNPIEYIVIHETANARRGADANAHGRLQASGNSRQASWHYTVDDKEAVQSFDDRAQCWHAGNRRYNERSIGIEICINSDGNYRKAVENAAALTAHLMKRYGIPLERVIQHNAASGKDCPRIMRAGSKGVTWGDFRTMVSGSKAKDINASKAQSKPKSNQAKSIAQMAREVILGKHGTGHNARRRSLGLSVADYEKVRAEVNRQLGAGNSAKPAQSKPKKSSTKTSSKTVSQMASEVLAGKHGAGHTNRRKSLGISASLYEQVRAEVNRRARGGKASAPKQSKPGKSIAQMAREVLAGEHGNGHENRRRSLGVDKATYERVRREVNRRA